MPCLKQIANQKIPSLEKSGALLDCPTKFINPRNPHLANAALRGSYKTMGRQWLHAKRAVASLKKSQSTGKLVKEIMVAAKVGGADPEANARLAAAIAKARKESVSRDVIERAISKGSGQGGDGSSLEHLVFEGYAPHKVPVIVEALTDNSKRTLPEIRVTFRKGQLGSSGSNKFLFDQIGIVEAYSTESGLDREEVAIEAGADDVVELTEHENDDVPAGTFAAKFFTDRAAVHQVATWLSGNGWSVVTAEIGYRPKQVPELDDDQRAEVGDFLQELEDHDDVSRVWAAIN